MDKPTIIMIFEDRYLKISQANQNSSTHVKLYSTPSLALQLSLVFKLQSLDLKLKITFERFSPMSIG